MAPKHYPPTTETIPVPDGQALAAVMLVIITVSILLGALLGYTYAKDKYQTPAQECHTVTQPNKDSVKALLENTHDEGLPNWTTAETQEAYKQLHSLYIHWFRREDINVTRDPSNAKD